MTHVITRACCNDAACIPVCPVNCIHPTPDEPDYGSAEMLYIDPEGCIDCGACVDVCPVEAIVADYDLPEEFARYEDIAERYFSGAGKRDYDPEPVPPVRRTFSEHLGELRIAIVGTGPAACYAAEELAGQSGLQVRVDMFERLLTPGGLVRFGVAPDHQDTKRASDAFNRTMRRKNVRVFFNTEVGVDITHEQLSERYHAIVYAVGALSDRALHVPGESLPGSQSATEFVAWYNGHPDFADLSFDLTSQRAVIIGNGNVALDVARILASPADQIAKTDIADHAIAALTESQITDVVVVGRRGPREAAFTTKELLGLDDADGFDVVAKPDEIVPSDDQTDMSSMKADLLAEIAVTESQAPRSVTLRFCASPAEILGDDKVEGIRSPHNKLVESDGRIVAEPTGEHEDIECGLVLRSVGYRGQPIKDIPFDSDRGIVPNESGRVTDSGEVLIGVYTTGWIKRGPSGVIGTNKKCARETAHALLADFEQGILSEPTSADDVAELLPRARDIAAWKRIDDAEKKAGRAVKRPRVKVTNTTELLDLANGANT